MTTQTSWKDLFVQAVCTTDGSNKAEINNWIDEVASPTFLARRVVEILHLKGPAAYDTLAGFLVAPDGVQAQSIRDVARELWTALRNPTTEAQATSARRLAVWLRLPPDRAILWAGMLTAPSRVFYACYEHWTNPASPTPLPEPRPNDAWVVASDDETNASPGAPGCTSESDTAASVVGDDEDLPAAPSPQKRRRRDPLSNEDTEVETPRWFRVRDASDAGWTCKRGNALLEALASPESADQPFPQTVYPVLWTHAVLALRERLVEVRVVPTTTAPPPAAAGVQVLGARVNTAAAAGVRRYCPIARPSVFMAVGTSKRTLLPLLRLLASAVLYATPRVLQAVTFAVPPDLLFAADLHPPARVNRVLAELARQVGVCACPLPVRDGRLVQFTCAGLLVPHLGASWRMQHCGELVAVSRTLHAWGRDNGLQCYNATPRRVTINRADLCSDGDGDDGEPLAVLFAAAACQNRTVWAVVQFTASVVNGPNAKCRLRVAAQKILSATPVPVPRS